MTEEQQQQYRIKWNCHNEVLTEAIKKLRHDTSSMDVTLFCQGEQVKAHSWILCACSPYFESDLMAATSISGGGVILMLNKIPINHLEKILDFMYTGELTVAQDDLEQLSNSAKHLQVKGLYEPEDRQDSPRESERRDMKKARKVRTTFTPKQLERLEAEFQRQQYMAAPEREQLASSLNLTKTQVNVWFQNRRIKWRNQQIAILNSLPVNLMTEDDDDGSGISDFGGSSSSSTTSTMTSSSNNTVVKD